MSLKIDHITILVKSIEGSLPYYRKLLEILGFEYLRDYVFTDNNGFVFQFNQARDDSKDYERYGPGMNHLGFSAPTPEFVQQVQHEMQQAGFDVPEIQSFGDARALFMKDPDGIRFEVTFYPPGMSVVD
jgi:catechol 2,3-dioxygenase-like lactoylglutathione lyase family enzyme